MTGGLATRLASRADLKTLVALDTAAASDSSRSTKIAHWIDRRDAIVATTDGHPVGYAAFGDAFFGDPFIAMVMVAGQHRRQGVGRALIAAMVRQAGAGKVWTSTNLSNRPMRALLARDGFVPSGTIDNLDPGDPEVIFLQAPDATASAVVTQPILNTDRLTLRPYCIADFDLLCAVYAGPRSRYIGGPLPPEKVWLNLMNSIGHWPLRGIGGWALDRRGDGVTVGEVALTHPPDYPEMELGWALFEGHEGHGYAFEAATAARDFAGSVRASTLVSYIDPENVRSIRLAERLGGRLDTSARTPHGAPCLVYRYVTT